MLLEQWREEYNTLRPHSGLGYQTPEAFAAAWRAEGATNPPEVWGVERMGMEGITIRTVVTTIPAKQWAVARELRLRIKEALDAAGIPLARPPAAPFDPGPAAPPR